MAIHEPDPLAKTKCPREAYKYGAIKVGRITYWTGQQIADLKCDSLAIH